MSYKKLYLRHTYAVMAIQSGGDIKTVQENLGHVTAQMKKASADRTEQKIRAVSRRRVKGESEDKRPTNCTSGIQKSTPGTDSAQTSPRLFDSQPIQMLLRRCFQLLNSSVPLLCRLLSSCIECGFAIEKVAQDGEGAALC